MRPELEDEFLVLESAYSADNTGCDFQPSENGASIWFPVASANSSLTLRLRLDVECPPDYPGSRLPVFRVAEGEGLPNAALERLTQALRGEEDSFGWSPEEPAIMLAVDRLKDLIAADESYYFQGSKTSTSATEGKKQQEQQQKPAWIVLWFDHLLQGKEHKKEANVLKALGSELTGLVCYGHPGLLILTGPGDTFRSFQQDCRRIGKTPTELFSCEAQTTRDLPRKGAHPVSFSEAKEFCHSQLGFKLEV